MEAVATAGVEVVVQNLINFLKEEYSLLRGFEEDAGKLQETLEMVQAYLSGAEKKSTTQAVKIWLRRLEDVAFHADNTLDELNYHFLYKKVRQMDAPLPKLKNKRCDVPKLVDMLIQTYPEEEKRMFSIVALVGMGGMGKTTLTKKVFHHERVKARFGSLLWVHVSQTFDPIILFKRILSSLTSHGGDECQSKEAILRKLQEALKAKTYLLVLDDVWNEDGTKWDDFLNSMSGVTSTMGNGIIITTRNQEVASIVRPLEFTLSGLSDDDCWSIIKSKAFDRNEEVPPQFEITGKKIAEACRGLPLAANVVGGVLRRYKSEEEWLLISVNCLSDAEDGSTPVRYMFLEEESSHISKEVAKQLRTLILKSGTSDILFSDFQCLHNLTLDDDNMTELPNSIRELIHLRYLDISNTSIKDIPEWIGELSHMQTLRLSRVSSSQKLIVELPAEIGRLTSLQTLPYFTVGEEKGYHIEELGSLKNLKGGLAIKNLERVRDKEEALKANILQKQHLSELRFEWGSYCSGERNDESVLEGLRPHANLKKLTIYGYKGKRFPTWLQGEPQGSCSPLHNLIRIKLNEIVKCDMLEALPEGLDTLNSLESLSIERCRNLKSMGKPSCGEGENQGTLRRLSIIDCGELRELPCQMLESWAPTIEELKLQGLRSLMNLPMLIDCLAKSSHLTNLTIRGVPKLMSAGSVESWDLGKLEDFKYRCECGVGVATHLRVNIKRGGKLGVAASINSTSHFSFSLRVRKYRDRRIAAMVWKPLSSKDVRSIWLHKVEIWLKELEALAFYGYYVLDDFNYHFLRKKVKKIHAPSPKPKDKVLSCLPSCSGSRMSRCSKMAHAIKQINVKFESEQRGNTSMNVEWSEEASVGINETVNGILEGCCNSLHELRLC
ncbi:putative disease resistance protein RGA1 [Salvia hispanica]|uniref:putative disease resistance protein RGA1 n=1 Tax=Salvia hispanica TaxID=49212 RepID=UPI0020092A2A|nr:putative disease resistance protein RGA1 [Salvia hispanica]